MRGLNSGKLENWKIFLTNCQVYDKLILEVTRMKTVKIRPERTISLPKSVFKPNDTILAFCEGDTFIVKKLTLPDITKVPSRVKQKPMSLKQIVKEIHQYRKERRLVK